MSIDELIATAVREAVRAELPRAVREVLPEALREARGQSTSSPTRAKLTTGRAAKLAGVSTETIRAWASKGRFSSARDAATGRLVIGRDTFERFLAEREASPAALAVDIHARARSIVGRL